MADSSGVVRSVGRSSDGDSDIDSLGRDKHVVRRTLDAWLKSCRVSCRCSCVLGGRVSVGRSVCVHECIAGRIVGVSVWRSSNSTLLEL
jgi:hypothetical protein